MTELYSKIAPFFKSFISFRIASNRWNSHYERQLSLFDRYCATNYPEGKELLQEAVNSWCKQHESEKNNSCRARIKVIVSLVRFLRKRGLTGIEPPELPKMEKNTYIPHAFTREELERFFCKCDNLIPNRQTIEQRSRRLTIPVFFRLIHSSGIRTIEARMLKRKSIDLSTGVLDIRNSKGDSQHYVVLHASMLKLMCTYDRAIENIYPNREYFFPAKNGGYYSKEWVHTNFRQLWDAANDSHAVANDFRHHYAIDNINRWVDEGFEFTDKLYYLSKSMGHATIENTRYYYSLVPSMANLLKEKTEAGFNKLIPEVDDEDWC